MKSALLTLSLFLSCFVLKAQYVFTGNGAWSDVNNWQNGSKPPSTTISSGVTVTIQGTATTSTAYPYDLSANNGSLIIAAGGSLSINIETQFSNQGSVTVNGSLTSNTMWEAYNGSSLTVNGTFNNKNIFGNQALITINDGGIINNSGDLDNTFVNPIGKILLNCGGTINNTGTFVPGDLTSSSCATITNSSVLTGNCTITGDLVNGNMLSPGASPRMLSPSNPSGTYTISGDYTATSSAIHNFEVAGTDSGNYDVLNANGNVALNGTLNVSLINGFTPSTTHDLPIITGNISGTFTTVNIPGSYSLVYTANSVLLRHIFITDYTFVGNGNWSDPANWEGGIMPGNVVPSGSNVYINGSAQTCSSNCNDLTGNNGSIIVSTTGSLTFQSDILFVNAGSVVVDGTLINKKSWKSEKNSSLTVNGNLENQNSLLNAGTITINDGGVIKNTGTLDNTYTYTSNEAPAGTIIINNGGGIENIPPGKFMPGNLTNNGGVLSNTSILSGNSTITGALTNSGTLAPGNPSGIFTVSGDYTATPTATHNFEIGGTASGNYDVLNVSGTVSLNGALNVSLINGFTPTTSHDLTIITGTINGTFSTVNIPDSYSIIYNANSVVLRHTDEYTFTGSGNWNDAANWQGGKMPGNFVPKGSIVYINGSAQTCAVYCGDLSQNAGSIIVNPGGSLTIQADTVFVNTGSITIYGTLINKRYWKSDKGSSITIYGILDNRNSLLNAGSITIKNGGVLKNTGTLDNTFVYTANETPEGEITLDCGGTMDNQGVFKPGKLITGNCVTLINSATLSGNSTINGNLNNSGTLSPGNSPGVYIINGNYTATATAIHNFEVAGTAPENYDMLQVSGSVNLNGTLNVSLINGFTPSADHDLPIMTGAINGTFTAVNIPGSYSLVYTTNSVLLRHTSALPVNFIVVSVKKRSNGEEVSWKVQGEQNVSKYEIEKSKDGSLFITIGFVNAAGLNSYSFTDVQSEAKCFYRIKTVDINGLYKYSPVSIYNQGRSFIKLNAFPSPAQQKIIVQHSMTTVNSKLYLVSPDGKTIKIILPHPFTQETEIDMSALKSGIYLVQFQNGGEKQSIKIQKL